MTIARDDEVPSTVSSRVPGRFSVGVNAFYEKVIKVKADVAAFLVNCFPSA
jgi:hypothetical protein